MPKLSDCLKQGPFSKKEKRLAKDISFVEGRLAEASEYVGVVEKAVQEVQLSDAWNELPGTEGDYTVPEIKKMAKAAGASRKEIAEAVRYAKKPEPVEKKEAPLKPTPAKPVEKAPEKAEKVETKAEEDGRTVKVQTVRYKPLTEFTYPQFRQWVEKAYVGFRNAPVMRTGKGDKGLKKHLEKVSENAYKSDQLKKIGFTVSGFAPSTPSEVEISQVFDKLSQQEQPTPPITQAAADKILAKFNKENGTKLVYQGPQKLQDGEIAFYTITDMAPADESPTGNSTFGVEEFTPESVKKAHDEKVEAYGGKEKEPVEKPKKPSITGEDGRIYIIEDLASSIYKAGQSLAGFTRKMKAKLGKAYSQIAGQIKEIYNRAKEFISRPLGEVGAIGDQETKTVYAVAKRKGQKAQQKFDTEEEARTWMKDRPGYKLFKKKVPIGEDNIQVADVTEAEAAYENFKDIWFGQKDVKILESKVEKRLFQKELKAALGKDKYDQGAKDYDKAIQIYMDLKRNPEHLDIFYDNLTNEQKRIVDLSQKLPRKVLKIADKLRTSYDALGIEALDEEVITNVLDNYAGRVWDLDKKGSETGRKFGTTTRHAKKRKFDTILEGWSSIDAEGNEKTPLELKIEGATNSLQVVKEEIVKTIGDKRFIKALGKVTDADGNALLTPNPPRDADYKEVKHPNFVSWKPVGSVKAGRTKTTFIAEDGSEISLGKNFRSQKRYAVMEKDKSRAYRVVDSQWEANTLADTMGGNFHVEERTTLWEKRKLYAPEKQADNLNNILGTSALYDIPGSHTVTKYNAIFKSWILQTSLFHHLAFMRSYYLGTNKKKFSEMSIRKAYKDGVKAIEDMTPEVILGVKNGLTLGIKQDWEESMLHEKTKIGEILDKTAPSKAVKDKIIELRNRQTDFLFGEFGAGLKAKAFMIEYRNQLKDYPEQDKNEIAKRVASLINDDFGGLHLGRLGRNPTVQHVFRLLALAPDWTESNVRSMIKVFANKSGSKAEKELYQKFWAGIVMKAGIASLLLNFALAGGDPDEFKENYERAWQAGNLKWTKIDITPIYKVLGGATDKRKYASAPGHFTDPQKFVSHPIRSAHHKGSVLYGILHELVVGTDWKGHKFTTLPELIETGKTVKWGPGHPISYSQLPSYMLSQIVGLQPVQIQNFVAWMLGEMESFDAIGNSLGLGITSTYGGKSNEVTKFDDYKKSINKAKKKETEAKGDRQSLRKVRGQYEKELAGQYKLKSAKGVISRQKKIIKSTEGSRMSEEAKKKRIGAAEERIEKAASEFNDYYNTIKE